MSSMRNEKDGGRCVGRVELLEREPACCQEEWVAATTAHAHRNVVVAFEVLPPSLAAGLAVRYSSRVARSPAAHAPGVRSGRPCHTQPTRPWESPVRPAVGSGRSSHTRLQQPASRSASGRVLSPPYAAVRPNAKPTGARGQRASRPASGAHPTRGRPVCCRHALVRARPVQQPARAAKAPRKLPLGSDRKLSELRFSEHATESRQGSP